ncbi:DUF4253 domain-containing protein [Pseudonocardia phyllosphaerae]|uniref:DUF4253 domain-containing protein n=1 Tax=Pseudonocardia phyllosphaerae TaxID=3390502 RepID=UPI00397AD4F5
MTLTDDGSTGAVTFVDSPAPELYGSLLHSARATGRCPVRVRRSDLKHSFGAVPDPAVIDALDGREVLADWWRGPCRPDCPCGVPLPETIPQARIVDSYPDLSRRAATLEEAAAYARFLQPGELAVVAAHRPADTPAVLGWPGAGNYVHEDLASMSAVLRYWESRWGALVVSLSRSRMTLTVANPPTTDEECVQAAGEHIAFCPDQQDPQNGDFYSLERYGHMIRGARAWGFWWD